MSELAAFAVIGNIRDRIIEFGWQNLSQETLDDLLTYCGLPASNDHLYSLCDAPPPRPDPINVQVYVLAHRTGNVAVAKVGISQRPTQRCRGLASGTRSDLYVYATTKAYARPEARRIEASAHALLAECDIGGEWFSCGPELAWRAVLEVGGDIGEIV